MPRNQRKKNSGMVRTSSLILELRARSEFESGKRKTSNIQTVNAWRLLGYFKPITESMNAKFM